MLIFSGGWLVKKISRFGVWGLRFEILWFWPSLCCRKCSNSRLLDPKLKITKTIRYHLQPIVMGLNEFYNVIWVTQRPHNGPRVINKSFSQSFFQVKNDENCNYSPSKLKRRLLQKSLHSPKPLFGVG